MRLFVPILYGMAIHVGVSGQVANLPSSEPAQVEFSVLHLRRQPVPPPYPPLARIAKVQGTVVLGLTIDQKGFVERTEAVEGPVLLRPAAEAFAREWRFDPMVLDGQAARVKVQVGIPFRLTDVLGPPSSTQAPQTVLAFEELPSSASVPVDSTLLQAEARAILAQLGLVQVTPSEADKDRTFHLKLQVQTFRTEDGIFIHNVRVRGSLLGDQDLQADEPGNPPRIIRLGHMLAQRGESGFQDSLLRTVRNTLRELVVLPAPNLRAEKGKGAEGQVGGRPPATPDSARAKVVDFDFSQIKVKRQPPAPRYPSYAKEHRVQGTVVIEITVDPTGHPAQAEAVAGPEALLMAAIRYALDWEFEPALLNGVPQYARFKLTMPFRLR